MNINATIDRIREPYGVDYLVRYYGKIIFSGSFEACKKFCKSSKLPLFVIPSGTFAWRELD